MFNKSDLEKNGIILDNWIFKARMCVLTFSICNSDFTYDCNSILVLAIYFKKETVRWPGWLLHASCCQLNILI